MKVHLSTITSQLLFRFPFRIAHGERTFTDVVFVKAACAGEVAYGEATLPPYLPDNIATTLQFFSLPELATLAYPFDPAEVFDSLDKKYAGYMPAKAALDMALWRLKAQLEKTTTEDLLHVSELRKIPHTYTLGVGSKEEMKKKLDHGLSCGYTFFKLKLDGTADEEIISNYRQMSQFPFAVDANQAWSDEDKAIIMARHLSEAGCTLIEQPFHRSDREKSQLLMTQADIPIIADEACQRLSDLDSIKGSFDGINIKLQKCGGITEALRMISRARDLKMKILIGCMSESSVGCSAGELLAPLCDWADLDGPALISNDNEVQSLF